MKRIPILLGILIGIIVSGTCVYAATLYEATEVAYDNSSSGTSNINVQTALDELYEKVGDLTGKQLKHELLVNVSGVAQSGSKTLTRDYLYIIATGASVRTDVEGQKVTFGGTASKTDIVNAYWAYNKKGYGKAYSLYTNPKKGQTISWSTTWNGLIFAIGIYEE